MRYRKLSPTGDMTFGNGAADFYTNDPLGVAQAAKTRLELDQGEWFLNLNDGTPWKTHILGKYTGATRDLAIQTRLLGTTGVNSIVSYSSSLDRETRKFQVNALLDTIYGPVTVQGQF